MAFFCSVLYTYLYLSIQQYEDCTPLSDYISDVIAA